jgi:formate dehydrogenase major subunit
MSAQTNVSLNNPVDYGTPRRVSEKLVTLEIDGVEVSVPEGTSVMSAAMDAGVKVPKLCATDSLEPFGSRTSAVT